MRPAAIPTTSAGTARRYLATSSRAAATLGLCLDHVAHRRRVAARAGPGRARGCPIAASRVHRARTRWWPRADVHRRGRRRDADQRRHRGRCRHRLHLRGGGRRDLALRSGRRSADGHLPREEPRGGRDQRPGHGADGGDASRIRRQDLDSRQRAARGDDSRRRRRRVTGAREVRHEVARRSARTGDPACRRLPDVRVPEPLSHERTSRLRALRRDDAHVLPGRPGDEGGRDVPPTEPGSHAAPAGRGGGRGTEGRRTAREGDRTRPRCLLHGRHRPATGSGGAGRGRDDHRRRSRELSQQDRAGLQRHVPRLHGPQGRSVEPEPRAAADPQPVGGVRPAGDGPPECGQHPRDDGGHEARLRRSRSALRRPGVRQGADDRPLVQGVRGQPSHADRSDAREPRAAARQSVAVRRADHRHADMRQRWRRAARRPTRTSVASGHQESPATRPPSRWPTRTATSSPRRLRPGGCWAAPSWRATPACP